MSGISINRHWSHSLLWIGRRNKSHPQAHFPQFENCQKLMDRLHAESWWKACPSRKIPIILIIVESCCSREKSTKDSSFKLLIETKSNRRMEVLGVQPMKKESLAIVSISNASGTEFNRTKPKSSYSFCLPFPLVGELLILPKFHLLQGW